VEVRGGSARLCSSKRKEGKKREEREEPWRAFKQVAAAGDAAAEK